MYPDNPSNHVDWANVQNLFQFYRVNAMKIRFFPTVTADTTFGYVPGYVAGYVVHDINRTTFSSMTPENMMGYENCRFVNMAPGWKYYRKMNRNIPSDAAVKLSSRGYITTASRTSTQIFMVYVKYPFGTGWNFAGKTLGYVMTTWYLSAFGRQ
jgi:hypothetical protein